MKKKSNRKIFIVFGIIILVSFIFGIGIGIGVEIGHDAISSILENVSEFLTQNAQWFLVANFVFLALSIIFLVQGKRLALKIDDENDEIYEKTDEKLTNALNFSNILTILAFIFFAVGITGHYILYTVVIFLFQVFAVVFIQYLAVEQAKKLCPEKKGNILDTKFQKEWLSTCDEAEKQRLGEAAYKSMATTQSTILVFMLIAMLLSLVSNNQFASIAIGIIWLIQTQSFVSVARKLGKRKKDIEKD